MGRYPTLSILLHCLEMSGPNQYAAGPPDVSGQPGPSNEEEFSVSEVLKCVKELERVQKGLVYKVELLTIGLGKLTATVDNLVAEQAVATRTLNESIRSLCN